MRKALLVIDMQKDLCYDKRRKKKALALAVQIQRLIEKFIRCGYPVYYVCFALSKDDEQFKRFGDRYCVEGTEGAEIIDELLPLKGQVIFKRKHSAFYETRLDKILKKDRVEEIYLTGMQTQICIMTTAADAYFRGYQAVIIAEGVLSTREKNKKWALNWIDKYVGRVASIETILNGLR